MHDLRDPHSPHGTMQDFYDWRIQLAGAAVLLLLIGGIIIAGMYSGGEVQVASNVPPAITGPAIPPSPAQ
jgi:hypothetical protein